MPLSGEVVSMPSYESVDLDWIRTQAVAAQSTQLFILPLGWPINGYMFKPREGNWVNPDFTLTVCPWIIGYFPDTGSIAKVMEMSTKAMFSFGISPNFTFTYKICSYTAAKVATRTVALCPVREFSIYVLVIHCVHWVQ